VSTLLRVTIHHFTFYNWSLRLYMRRDRRNYNARKRWLPTTIQMEDITIIQLKDELRQRKMKTIDVKVDLIKCLQEIIMKE